MSCFRTGDPLDDFNRLDRLQAQREAMLPVCDKCRNKINEESFFEIEGTIYCEKCMHDEYGRSTEDYLRDNHY